MITDDIICQRGEAVILDCVLDPVVAAGIAGWTIRFALKAAYSDVAMLVDQAMTITDNAACTFTATISSTNTIRTAGTYYFDIWRTNAGFETPLISGRFIINPDVRY